ncbi:MAG: beta-lactamase family protein [Planctomycetes bacterium]|nr:beta-lactamase family protein [Planctomycetota bacterium]
MLQTFRSLSLAVLLHGLAPCQDPAAAGLDENLVAELRAAIESRIAAGQSKGVGLLVLRDGKLALREASGTLRLEDDVAAEPLAATFIATAALIAVERGHVRLEDQARLFVQEPLPDSLASRTLGELLAQRGAGFSTELRGRRRGPTAQRAPLGAPDPLRLTCRMIETATITEWRSWIRQELFEPLGMRSTRLEAHDPTDASPRRGVRATGFAVQSTAQDLASFGEFVRRAGMVDERRILSPDGIAKLCGDRCDGATREASPGFAFRRERVVDGTARTLATPVQASATLTLDRDRGFVVVVVESGGRRAPPLTPELMAILRRAVPKPDDASPRSFAEEGPHEVWTGDQDPLDPRDPQLPARISRPDERANAPIVVVLQDDETSDAVAEVLDAHWASHGFAVVRLHVRQGPPLPAHEPGKPAQASQYDRRALAVRGADLHAAPFVEPLLLPARRVSAWLDELVARRGFAEQQRVVVVGHGRCAIAALALAGVEFEADGRRLVSRDARVAGAIALGAPSRDECGLEAGGIAALAVPTLFVPAAPTLRAGWRSRTVREVFDSAPPGEKYLVELPDARALATTPLLAPRHRAGASDVESPDHAIARARELLLASSTAFLVAVLRPTEGSPAVPWFDAQVASAAIERK